MGRDLMGLYRLILAYLTNGSIRLTMVEKPERNLKPNRNRNQTETLRYPTGYYISISKITEPRTERIPEYIKILIIYTYNITN